MLVYRVSKRAYARDLTGEGSCFDGGRWNSAGNPMIYTAISPSLALLEVLAHATVLPTGLVMVTIRLPAGASMERKEISELPIGWDARPPTAVSQRMGDIFLSTGKMLALRVPSVIVRPEDNILINPFYSQARHIEIVSVEDQPVDPRLK
jgi:RES domain-containing protein